MALIKTPEEIEKLKRGGVILSRVLRQVMDHCRAGVSTEALEKIVRQEFERVGGRPSFLGYQNSSKDAPYPGALCVSVNDEIVHGLSLPSRMIRDGDVVGFDLGLWYQGLTTDAAATVLVGRVKPEARALVEHTREALQQALLAVKEGVWIADIGAAIEDYIAPYGYGIVKDLTGHGVGHAVHEEPQIPNYREPRAPRVRLEAGMVLAIEPMITLGTWKIQMKDDGWTIMTADGSPAAHFEVTIVVTKTGYELITPWP